MTTPRTFAIGDIHGCAKALDALLDALGPRPDDTIITLGDYVNKGPDSCAVLDRLINLRGRCHLLPILGNHDHMLLDVRSGKHPISWFLDMDGTASLDSYGPGRSLDRIPEAHVGFLEDCLDYHETGSHIFTHANYFPHLPMAAQPVGMLRWESLRDTVPGPHDSGKAAILGHTSQKDGEVLDLGHLTCIDTNCSGGGWLTALDVQTGDLLQFDRDGRPRPA